MKRLLSTLSAVLFAGALSALAASLPLVPSTPTFSDPAAIVPTLNAIIQQLNGQAGYAPAQPVSLGSSCSSAAGGTPVTCNGQRGTANFTGLTVTTTGTTQTIVVTNSAIIATSICQATWNSAFTAGSGVYVATITPTAGSLSVVYANGGTTANAVTTGALGFSCT